MRLEAAGKRLHRQEEGCVRKGGVTNVCKKHEKFNIRPVLSYQDSSGTCPEVPPGPEGQARPDLCPTFEYSGYLVFPRDLNYFCIANLNSYLERKKVGPCKLNLILFTLILIIETFLSNQQ